MIRCSGRFPMTNSHRKQMCSRVREPTHKFLQVTDAQSFLEHVRKEGRVDEANKCSALTNRAFLLSSGIWPLPFPAGNLSLSSLSESVSVGGTFSSFSSLLIHFITGFWHLGMGIITTAQGVWWNFRNKIISKPKGIELFKA